MIINLSKKDNLDLLEFFEIFNNSQPIPKKITIDTYIERIEFGEEIKLFCIKIEPYIPEGCTKENIGSGSKQLGAKFEMILSQLDPDIIYIMDPFLRDLKIKYVIS